jgi:hypothetical protein
MLALPSVDGARLMIPPLQDPDVRPGRAPPDLPAMRARFIADFVGGRIGQHHNTFQHRERVLRQITQAQRAVSEPMVRRKVGF